MVNYFFIDELMENKKTLNINQLNANIKFPSEIGYSINESRESEILTRKLIFDIFPELKNGRITALEFLDLAKIRGFKDIYFKKAKK